jgi:hypothetical protein
MLFDYRFEQYHNWKENRNISFQRKLENETAFDGIIKIYTLKTNSGQLMNFLKINFSVISIMQPKRCVSKNV